MTGLAPQVSVLALSLGLLFALVCYLVTNLSPGGMITPGWLGLVLIVRPTLALLIGAVAAVTYVASRLLQRVVIIYGKRLFATVVLVGVFLQATVFVFTTALDPAADYTTLGFIIPGLVAYQLIRQPVGATLSATAAVSALAYLVVLTGVELNLIRAQGADQLAAQGLSGAPEIHAGALQLTLVAVALLSGLLVALRSGVRARRSMGAADTRHPAG